MGWAAPRGAQPALSLLGLAPGGVCRAVPVAGSAVGSCPTISPLPAFALAGFGAAVSFLWHFPWGRPRRELPGTVHPWSPDFPPRFFGEAAVRPAGGGEVASTRGAVKDTGRTAPAMFKVRPVLDALKAADLTPASSILNSSEPVISLNRRPRRADQNSPSSPALFQIVRDVRRGAPLIAARLAASPIKTE